MWKWTLIERTRLCRCCVRCGFSNPLPIDHKPISPEKDVPIFFLFVCFLQQQGTDCYNTVWNLNTCLHFELLTYGYTLELSRLVVYSTSQKITWQSTLNFRCRLVGSLNKNWEENFHLFFHSQYKRTGSAYQQEQCEDAAERSTEEMPGTSGENMPTDLPKLKQEA